MYREKKILNQKDENYGDGLTKKQQCAKEEKKKERNKLVIFSPLLESPWQKCTGCSVGACIYQI